MLVINFVAADTNFATGEFFVDLRAFGPRDAGRALAAPRAAGRVDDGRDFVTDGEAMPTEYGIQLVF